MISQQDKTRQGKARQGKARQGKASQPRTERRKHARRGTRCGCGYSAYVVCTVSAKQTNK
jgi:hypothetical protein